MTKQDWIRKLSSRKFWLCVCGFAVSLLTMLRRSDAEIALVTSLITSAGCLVAYILSEGYVDAKAAQARAQNSEDEKPDEK